MKATKRTVPETAAYFRCLASQFEDMAHRAYDQEKERRYYAKAEAYEVAAFELEHNTEWCSESAVFCQRL